MNDLELYGEEQLQASKELHNKVDELSDEIGEVKGKIKPPHKDVRVSGTVKVENPVTEMEITNFDELVKEFGMLYKELKEVKSELAKEKQITVANPQKEVSVSNFSSIEKKLDVMASAINALEMNVNVEKQDIKFPNTAKDYMSVRLTDGKGYYKVLNTLANQLTKLPLVTSTDTGELVLAIANADGTPIVGGGTTPANTYGSGLYDTMVYS